MENKMEKENKEALELLQDVRDWEKSWGDYTRGWLKEKPLDVGEFSLVIASKYNISKKLL